MMIDTLGEWYYPALAAAVGAIVNPLKRWKRWPGDATPILAFALGVGMDVALRGRFEPVSMLAGLAAAGGHEALSRGLRALGLGAAADRVLGKAKGGQQ
jgi:hypothetical protein